jgi:hypothetical protein
MLGETSFVDEVLEKGRSASTGGGHNRAVYGDPDGAVRALLRQCRSAGDEPAALSVADLRRLHGVPQALRRIAVHRLAARSRPCCGPPSPELMSTGLAGLARFALPHGPPGSTIWEVTMVAEVRPIGRSASAAGFVLGRRLDSIPFSPYHAMVIAVLALVGFVEGYDLAIAGLLLVMASPYCRPSPPPEFTCPSNSQRRCAGAGNPSASRSGGSPPASWRRF